MKRLFAVAAIIGGVVAVASYAREPRRRLAAAVSDRMRKRMLQIMASLPEDSPPKLVMSMLPQVRNQNEEILRLLREQNELLRDRQHATQ